MNSQVFTLLCMWGKVPSVALGKPRRVAGAGGLEEKSTEVQKGVHSSDQRESGGAPIVSPASPSGFILIFQDSGSFSAARDQ